MSRWFVLSVGLLFFATQYATAGPRLRIGRVEFGIPFVDSFVTVHGDRTTVKVFSRGDITNVHTDGGTRVDVGIRSLLSPRPALRGSEPNVRTNVGPAIDLGEPQPLDPAPDETPSQELNRKGPLLPIPEENPLPESTELQSIAPLEEAEKANARGDYRTAEKLASLALKENENDQAAYSIRAASRIGQGEQQRNVTLIRQGLADINKAIKLSNKKQDKRDYVIWFIGMNQLAAFNADREQAARNAGMVDEFTTQYIDRFPDELKGQVYRQQGYARLLLGKRAAADESFRHAGIFAAESESQ